MLRYSFANDDAACAIEAGVAQTLKQHQVTADLTSNNAVSTASVGDAVARFISEEATSWA